MTPSVDVVVVGAGPAGLAAAVAAAGVGARVVVLDADARPGGQYWRQGPGGFGPHHHDLEGWLDLVRPWEGHLSAGRVEHRPGHRVWRVDGASCGAPPVVQVATRSSGGVERSYELAARAVVVATGAHDRVLPFPGWELPGVLTPGAVQTLLKADGVPAGRDVVVAGTGPFLLPVAVALLKAGSRVAALLEAGDGAGWLTGGPPAWRALAAAGGRLAEGAGYAARLARYGVRPRLRHAVVRAHGDEQVEAVTVARLDRVGRVVAGSQYRVRCDAVAVGWGFTARSELALAAGAVPLTGPDGGLAVAADACGRTAAPGVLVAGELTGIGGARLAVVTGRLAGAAAAGLRTPDPALLARRRSLVAFAQLMHRAHRVPPGWLDWLDDDTVICRCEEVPLRRVVEAVEDLAATDVRTTKLLTRCGMGWCQGRVCGEVLASVVAARSGRPAPSGPDVARRPVAVPVTLGALADPTIEETHERS